MTFSIIKILKTHYFITRIKILGHRTHLNLIALQLFLFKDAHYSKAFQFSIKRLDYEKGLGCIRSKKSIRRKIR